MEFNRNFWQFLNGGGDGADGDGGDGDWPAMMK